MAKMAAAGLDTYARAGLPVHGGLVMAAAKRLAVEEAPERKDAG
jgi:hypothetical protein